MGLAEQGYKTCAVDFDIGLRNLDIHLGCERRVIFDFVNALNIARHFACVLLVGPMSFRKPFETHKRLQSNTISKQF